MLQVESSLPTAGAKHTWPEFVPHGFPVLWRHEIADLEPNCIVEAGESNLLQAGWVDVLDLAGERGDPDKIGGSLHHCRKPFVLYLTKPLLEGDRRLISPGVQQQPFFFGRKCLSHRGSGQGRVDAETDR